MLFVFLCVRALHMCVCARARIYSQSCTWRAILQTSRQHQFELDAVLIAEINALSLTAPIEIKSKTHTGHYFLPYIEFWGH